MADYAKKTVAELTEILKSRGLTHTGKKADLVARLNEADQNAETQEPDEVVSEPAPAQPESTTTAQPADTTATAESAPSEAAPPGSTVEKETETETAEATYTLNLKASDVDSELAKRKARAARFGTAATNGDDNAETSIAESEALKNLERAKRFGAETTAISKLDEALSTESTRGSKRKADEPSSLDDPGLRRGFANRGRGRGDRIRGRGGRKGGNPAGPQGISKTPAYMSDKDKAAAEARKRKFATA